MSRIFIAFVALSAASPAFAQDLSFEWREHRVPGQSTYLRGPHRAQLVANARLAVLRAAGGGVDTPRGLFDFREEQLVLTRHDAGGTTIQAEAIRLRGRAASGHAEALRDGGVLVFAATREVDRQALAAIIRYGADGSELWRQQFHTTAPRTCRPDQTICGFINWQGTVVEGNSLWVNGHFKRGTLEGPNTTVRGRRHFNAFIVRLDLTTGRVLWTRLGGGMDRNLGKLGDDLVHWDGTRTRTWVQHVSADTGRQLHRVPLRVDGSIVSFIAHGDGYAGIVETHIAAEHRNVWHVVGWNARGERRFRFATDASTVIRAHGSTMLVGESRSPSRRDVGTVSDGARVFELDVSGRTVREATFTGWWFSESLRPSVRDGELALTGVLADGDRYAITSRRAGSMVQQGTIPGREWVPPTPGAAMF